MTEKTEPAHASGSQGNLDFLSGGGEMGALMRAKDWAATPIGPIAAWPTSLRTMVGVVLKSRFPMALYWGENLLTLYNDGYRPILGAKHPACIGHPFAEVWREIWHILGPQATGILEGGPATWNEHLLLPMNRKGYIEETYFTFSYSPVPDDVGSVGGMLVTCQETTEQVQNDRQLLTLRDLAASSATAKTAEEACETAAKILGANDADAPFVLVYLTDDNGNAAHLTATAGLEGYDGPGKPGTVSLTEPHAAQNQRGDEPRWPLIEAARTQRPVLVTNLVARIGTMPGGRWGEPPDAAVCGPLTRPGQLHPYGFLVAGLSPRREVDERYLGFFRLASDQIATALANVHAYQEERRRAEALAEIDRAKTAFFSNVSHELRTPLTLLLGPLEEAFQQKADALSPELRENLMVAHRNATRLLRLVNTLLDFSRIEAGRVQASYAPGDLSALTAELASNFRSACERAGLELIVDCAALGDPVYVDRDMWEKIVLNLISNAFKYTLEGGIRVELCRTDAHAELTVADTGTGIPKDALPHLFERFYRVPNAQGRTHEGTGIGLSLVHELVKLHGGSISVASRLGEGTTFTVAIPRGTQHLPQDRVRSAPAPLTNALGADAFVSEALQWLRGSGQMAELETFEPALRPHGHTDADATALQSATILLADDNADMREYLRRLLAPRFTVVTTADGEEALESIRKSPPELVLADVMMPRLDGFGLLRALREDLRTRSLPVILLSARAGEEARIEGLDAGADDYLVKPFSARELIARVETHVKLARQRREVDEAVRESEQRFRVMADSSPLLTWVIDPQGRIEFVNRAYCEFFGVAEHEVKDAGWQPVLHPDDADAYVRETMAGLAERRPFSARVRVRRADGAWRWIQTYAAPRFAPDGEFLGAVGSSPDITEAVQAGEALKEADRRKDEFLATLAHELRNPLAPIRQAAQISKAANATEAQIRWSHDVIERQVQHMALLLDDLLDVSRITRSRLELRKERIDLRSAIDAAVETARPSIDARRHNLTITLPDGPLSIEADPIRIAQVLANLLTNAAKYTEPRGTIRVSAQRDASEIVIRITDTGIGIDREALPRVFEMFSQVKSAIDRAEGGLGIGLALVKGLVTLHGGSVEARSEGAGRGSTFSVRLPVGNAAELPNPALLEGSAKMSARRPLRILIADDNRDAALSLAMVLELDGHAIKMAHDGREALEAAEAFRPEIVLLDIGMPRLNGYDVARRVREQPWGADAMLIAITGWGQDEDKRRAAEAGFSHHLTKPVSVDALSALLAEAEKAG